MSFLDFNGDGKTSFFEGAVGLGAAAYMGKAISDSHAREREDVLRRKYEDELDEQRDLYESELDIARASRRRRDSDWEDGDLDGYWEDDGELDWDDDPYSSVTVVTPNEIELAAARKVSGFLSSYVKPAEMRKETCLDCMFWHGEKPGVRRCNGCRVWFLVQLEYGASISENPPEDDKKTCSHFCIGTGKPTRCYDCIHWRKGDLAVSREKACGKWKELHQKEVEINRDLAKRFGPNVSVTVLDSDKPWVDEDVCMLFEPDRSLPAGYGLQLVEDAKCGALTQSGITKRMYVAGIPFEGRKEIWKCAKVDGDPDVVLVPEPQNPHDPNAIAVYVDDEHGGYVPADEALGLKTKLDAGWMATVSACDISVKPDKKKPGEDAVYVWLTVELSRSAAAAESDAKAGNPPVLKPPPKPKNEYIATDDFMKAINGPKAGMMNRLEKVWKDQNK